MCTSAKTEAKTRFISLTNSDSEKVRNLLARGHHASRTIKRGSILSQSQLGFTRKVIKKGLLVSTSTISRIRTKYRQSGLQAALYERNRSGRPMKVDLQLRSEVRLLICSPVPTGRCKWTGDLLLEQGIKRFNWKISRSTIYRILSSDDLKPWKKEEWCISTVTPEYLESMYNVLTIYEKPYDPNRPMVCVDELSKQIESDLLPSEIISPGKPLRQDYSYQKKSVLNFFVAVEPKAGKRLYLWSYKKTGKEFAYFCYYLVNFVYPTADKIDLVADNFKTHNSKMFFRYLDIESAIILCIKINWIYTPPHGSWLNMAENENNSLIKQCLNRRFDSETQLFDRITLYLHDRNQKSIKIHWNYTVTKAIIKFPGLTIIQSKNKNTYNSEIIHDITTDRNLTLEKQFPEINIHFIQENINGLQGRGDIKLLPEICTISDKIGPKKEVIINSEPKSVKILKTNQRKLKIRSQPIISKNLFDKRTFNLEMKSFPLITEQNRWKPKERLHWVDRRIFELIKLSYLIPMLAIAISKGLNKSEFTVTNTLRHLIEKNLIVEVLYSEIPSKQEHVGYICNYFNFITDPP